MHKQHEEG